MTQETHKSLKLAFALKDRSRLGHETEQAAKLRRIKACDEAATEIRYMHALIVQMAAGLETAYDHIGMSELQISHCNDSHRIMEALTAAKEYLK